MGTMVTRLRPDAVERKRPVPVQDQTPQRLRPAGDVVVQAKLTVGGADDPFEREADRAADAVMLSIQRSAAGSAAESIGSPAASRIRRSTSPAFLADLGPAPVTDHTNATRIHRSTSPLTSAANALVLRREPAGSAPGGAKEDEIDLDGEDLGPAIEGQQSEQLGDDPEAGHHDESRGVDSVRRAAASERASSIPEHGMAGGVVESSVASSIERTRGGGRPLDDAARTSMEGAFDADFSSVRIHEGSSDDSLNRSLNARAFTVGNDVYFANNQFKPSSGDGQRLLAHELAHVVQQGGATAHSAHRKSVIRRTFGPALVTSKAHLRDSTDWSAFKGPQLSPNDPILVDNANAMVQKRSVISDVTWRPAVSVPAAHVGAIGANRRGYIRKGRSNSTGTTLKQTYETTIAGLLTAAEQRYAGTMDGQLAKPAHVAFLLNQALRYDTWNGPGASLDGFISGFSAKQDKFDRIRDGAIYVANSLDHWRRWLNPTAPATVTITDVKFIESDLHEHGLGVIKVKFAKPLGPLGHKFATDTVVEAMIKPEDKSLEEALLGDDPTSAASKINQIVGLNDPKERLTTIKMSSNATYGSLVQLVKGMSAEDLKKTGGATPIEPAFHETLVFAYLAGLDDLHRENVFWDDGKPYLVDADNVLSHNQMLNKDNGKLTQGGFGGSYNAAEAKKNKADIVGGTNTVNSKILDAMMTDDIKKIQIVDALKLAIAGKQGRVVPIRTNKWANILKGYQTVSQTDKDNKLDDCSGTTFLVRLVSGFNQDIGPGLSGVAGASGPAPFYDAVAERVELKKDLDAGVVPFYTYDFSSGHVTHNGAHIYDGLTVDQAMNIILDKFDPTGIARA